MRLAVCFGLSILSSNLFAQAPPTETTMSALMSEVHELRLAIERSTLLGARTQIAIQRLQAQTERFTQAEQRLEEARAAVRRNQQQRQGLSAEIKDAETAIRQSQDPDERQSLERQLEMSKQRLAALLSDAELRSRENEVQLKFQTEQSELNRLQSDISQMEGLLDRAIQQITGQR